MATARSTDRHAGSGRREARLAVACVLVPPVAWAAALGLSYSVQDFACTAFTSAGRVAPAGAIGGTVVVLDAVLLVLTVAAGLAALRVHRRARGQEHSPTLTFLGLVGALLSAIFSLGIVLVAVNPLVLEVCP